MQGTTLEDFGSNIQTSLWSAKLLTDDPDALKRVHSAFISSGSDFILSATYQTSIPLYLENGYTESQAIKAIRSGVHLCHTACTESSRSPKPRCCLSLGPYGAVQTPTSAEYTGEYKEPYGPFPSASNSSDSRYTDALTDFHLERLKIFASDSGIWSLVDCIAFETIPLLNEGKAIRRALHQLYAQGVQKKPSYISYVFPAGQLPQSRHEGNEISAREIVVATFADGQGMEVPNGIGINCTKLEWVQGLVQGYESMVKELGLRNRWLVLYPDGGGATYQPETQTWREGEGSISEEVWAEQLANIGRQANESGLWGQVILGGCCKSGLKHIQALKEALYLTRP